MVRIGGIAPLFIRIGDLHVRSQFGIVELLAIYVLLGTSFIVKSVRWIFLTERKIVPWH